MRNALTTLLQIDLPIFQAPMAGISTPAMAAAVSNAGGLGFLAFGASTPAQARQMLADTRALTTRPFGVNLFCHAPAQADAAREAAWMAHLAPYFAEFGADGGSGLKEIYTSFLADQAMFELLLEERPAVISFHFGLPPQAVIDAFKGRGIVLLGGATDVSEARQIASAGLDGIIAQGYEAGGHRGVFDPANGDPARADPAGADPAGADPAIGTFALVQLIARATPLPVIATGGIMDGRGIAAALLLGASAAQLGTAFLLTPESNAGAGYRALLKSERALRTRTTSAISGRAARSIVNRYVEQVDGAGAPAAPDYPVAYDAGKRLHAAALAAGSFEFGATWAGQAAYLVREMGTAELMATLAGELQQTGI